jgi:hypothetical protein
MEMGKSAKSPKLSYDLHGHLLMIGWALTLPRPSASTLFPSRLPLRAWYTMRPIGSLNLVNKMRRHPPMRVNDRLLKPTRPQIAHPVDHSHLLTL